MNGGMKVNKVAFCMYTGVDSAFSFFNVCDGHEGLLLCYMLPFSGDQTYSYSFFNWDFFFFNFKYLFSF